MTFQDNTPSSLGFRAVKLNCVDCPAGMEPVRIALRSLPETSFVSSIFQSAFDSKEDTLRAAGNSTSMRTVGTNFSVGTRIVYPGGGLIRLYSDVCVCSEYGHGQDRRNCR